MSNNERRTHKKGKGLSREARQLLLLIGGVAVALVLVIGITVGIFFSKNPQANQPQESISDTSVSDPTSLPGEVVEEQDYNKDEFVLDVEKHGDTVLAATEDAGQEYVDNTLFIGDSNTYRYMMYAQTTLSNDIGITSMGLQDVLTEECVKFHGYSKRVTIPEAVAIMQPQRIIICFGTNNAGGSWSADYMVEQYNAVLDGIEKAWPYADIIISAVPPVAKAHQNTAITMTTIDAFNQAIAAMAEERGHKFLNTSEVLKDPDTGFAKEGYTIQDGIHLSQKGVEALFGYVRTHAYETEDRRPTPLKKVPKRDETKPYVITDENYYTGTVSGSKPEGTQIIFAPNDAQMGTIEGTLEQFVAAGTACTEVEAKPKEGYTFAHWSCTVGRIEDTREPKLSFMVPGNLTKDDKVYVTANFVKAGYTVTVKSSDPTAGTAGIVDGDTLYPEFDVKKQGDSIKLKAYVNRDFAVTHRFVGWFTKDSEEPISTQLEFTYTPSASVDIEARFEKIGITVDVSISPDAKAGTLVTAVKDDKKATVEVKANTGYTFSHWKVNGQDVAGVTATKADFDFATYPPVNNKLTVVAVFKADAPVNPIYKANVKFDSKQGSATVVSPTDATNVATFTATAQKGFVFDGWYNGDTKVSGDNPYKPTLTADLTLTAKFKADAPVAPIYKANVKFDSKQGSATVVSPTDATNVATFTATAKDGFVFDGWYDDAGAKVSGDITYKPTLTADLTLTAKFKAKETTPPAEHTHDWNAWASNNNGTHTRTCKGDANHTETNNCTGGTATCKDAAVCDVCKAAYGTPNGAAHTGGTATCIAKAVCTVCGQSYGELAGHTGGTATCTAKAVCTVCNQAYGDLLSHTPSAEATCTTPQTCTVCGTVLAAATGNHVDADGNGSCDVCGGTMPAANPGSLEGGEPGTNPEG